ncbi:MAG: hydrogenase maturation nickel metallochaperone HypA [Candidatus Bathyarchaeia archaeon]
MHEFSMAMKLFEAALKVAEQHRASKILSMELEIGGLTHLNDDQLRFSLKVLSEGTLAEGAEVLIKHLPVQVRCKRCDAVNPFLVQGLEELLTATCRKCGSRDVEFEGEETCVLKSIKVKT